MATEQLVRSEIDAGLKLIKVLDDANFGVTGALWLYSGDAGTWKFIIATNSPRKDIERKYLEAAIAVSKWRDTGTSEAILDLSRARIVSFEDPLIRGLAPIVKMDGLGEVRLTNNLVNGIFVEDALIHRMAA